MGSTNNKNNNNMHRAVLEARKTLRLLYDKKKSELGDKITPENFFPVDLVDLDFLVRLLGWELNRVEHAGHIEPTEELDAYADFKTRKITIGTRDTHKGRLNFSLAHEIGHVMLHREKAMELARIRPIRDLRGFKSPRNRFDVEANRFATELLMPMRAVKTRFKYMYECEQIISGSINAYLIAEKYKRKRKYVNNLNAQSLARLIAIHKPEGKGNSLVDFFGVSRRAMEIRLKELRIVIE